MAIVRRSVGEDGFISQSTPCDHFTTGSAESREVWARSFSFVLVGESIVLFKGECGEIEVAVVEYKEAQPFLRDFKGKATPGRQALVSIAFYPWEKLAS